MPDNPAPARKGRGALSNPEGRFETRRSERVDDGWGSLDEALPPLETIVRAETARSIISRNASPDIPFEQSINPYRGCEHGCVYCLAGDTLILMAGGTLKRLDKVRAGDVIYGTVRNGWYRRYTKTRVLAHWSVVKPAWRVKLEDGTELVAGSDHRFLTERGWKFVSGAEQGSGRRPHLTLNNRLMGTGAFAAGPTKNTDYKNGYLCGIIRGDGLLASYSYQRAGRSHGDQHQFRLALKDCEALTRTALYLQEQGIATRRFEFQRAVGARQALPAVRTHARANVEHIRKIIAWPAEASLDWCKGFLAGIFDAEGSCNADGVIRISNTDPEIIQRLTHSLERTNFDFKLEAIRKNRQKPITVVRLCGELRERLRFFHTTNPCILRKRNIENLAVKSDAKLRIATIEKLESSRRLFDITTGTGDFIANGVISHNCYARPSHAYLNLSPGLDFETRLFFKPNAAERLEAELRRPGYRCSAITLGANTDPYQPIEKRLGVTRGILEVLHRFRHPVAIITKSTLVERDIDLLAEMASERLATVMLSITTLDNDLKRTLEPRAASPAGRLRALAALREAGIPAGVMAAPIIPAINDGEIETILARAADAGALSAGYTLLRLPYELKDLFAEWLRTHFPLRADHVLNLIRDIRGGKLNQAAFGRRMRGEGRYAELIAQRFAIARRRLGLNRREALALDITRFRAPDTQLSLWD